MSKLQRYDQEIQISGDLIYVENSSSPYGDWCKSDDVTELEKRVEKMKCCGNCYWNTDAKIHDKCDQNQWVLYSANSRGRGICKNWTMREGE